MLWKTDEITGGELRGRDGDVGRVKDVYFDDVSWHVRYLVIETGGWLGRDVLIAPAAIRGKDYERRVLEVDLTRQQVRDSPPVDTARPVSRQHEADLHRHYGWPYYWSSPMLVSGSTVAVMPGTVPTATAVRVTDPARLPDAGRDPAAPAADAGERGGSEDDPHLRSGNAVRGYAIEATDGAIGHVEDFVIDDATWRIAHLVVDTRNWWPGKKVLVSPAEVHGLDAGSSTMHLNLARDVIKSGPEFDPAKPLSADYTDQLEAHYRHQRRRPPGP